MSLVQMVPNFIKIQWKCTYPNPMVIESLYRWELNGKGIMSGLIIQF